MAILIQRIQIGGTWFEHVHQWTVRQAERIVEVIHDPRQVIEYEIIYCPVD